MERLIALLAAAWRKADTSAWKTLDWDDRFAAGMKHGIAVGITTATDIVRSYARQQNVAQLEYAFGPLETWLPAARALEMRSESAAGVALQNAMSDAIDRLAQTELVVTADDWHCSTDLGF